MTKFVFSVFDSKAAVFMQPFFCVNRAVAVRSFKAAAQDPEHEFCKFAEDFTLFELGTFSEVDGLFSMHATPQSVVLAVSLKALMGAEVSR